MPDDCRICHHEGSDVRLVGCGCHLHARCIPIGLVVASATTSSHVAQQQEQLVPVVPHTILCPACHEHYVTGIHILPLSLQDLDLAVQIRQQQQQEAKATTTTHGGTTTTTLADAATTMSSITSSSFQTMMEAEASYLGLAVHHATTSTSSSTSSSLVASTTLDSHYHRTGRWNAQEIAFVDFLIESFDQGLLPLAQGIRLNDFLGQVLMCKGSRLTKKMKNAKLSLRSYHLTVPTTGMVEQKEPQQRSNTRVLDVELLSQLQEDFLSSVANDATRLELRFNLTKCWRAHFSDFCVQLGSSMLQANDWIASLEVMEQRAAQAEESIRKARRRRMGLALKTDVRTAPEGVFFVGQPVHHHPWNTTTKNNNNNNEVTAKEETAVARQNRVRSGSVVAAQDGVSSVHSVTSSDDGSDEAAEFISNMLDNSSGTGGGTAAVVGGGVPMEDFSKMFSDLITDADENTAMSSTNYLRTNCGSFLEEIVGYMETHDLPFQHVDVWVPSYISNKARPGDDNDDEENIEELRLCHAGHATRSDIDPSLLCQLFEYGEYSTKFSFASGVGLPGRVYQSGEYSWERHLDEADPSVFERAGGAKVYGVKTGLGIPLASTVIGRIVVAMYSISDVAEVADMVNKCVSDMEAFCPEPKWKLVVEMGSEITDVKPKEKKSAEGSTAVTMDHYIHTGRSPSTVAAMPVPGSRAGSVTSLDLNANPKQADEQRIADILGEHMPLCDLPGQGQSTSQAAPNPLLAYFMSLRLLLLRSASRRTADETDRVDVIVKSFQGYLKGSRRSEKDIAFLLVNDWRYLNELNHYPDRRISSKQMISKGKQDAHQCHVMEAPASVPTYSSGGQPTKMPFALGSVDHESKRKASFDSDSQTTKKRRVSSMETTDHIVHDDFSVSGANIVDEI